MKRKFTLCMPAKTARWLFTICTCLLMLQATATVRRVDASRPFDGDGSTWANAYRDFQSAIVASASGDEVWVKAGTYAPDAFIQTSFFMKNGVKIYGGFVGTETMLSQRNWTANRVELTQLANRPVIENFNVNSAALLDGVYIRNVSVPSSRTSSGYQAAGIINEGNGFPTLSNILFENCTGNFGGALYIEGGNSAITNVTFTGCTAFTGGAAYFQACSPALTNVVFNNNYLKNDNQPGYGGALYILGGSSVFTNVTFTTNRATYAGGAVYLQNCTPTLTNVIFDGNYISNNNSTSFGGAVYSDESAPVYTNVVFENNRAYIFGGAVYNVNTTTGATRKPAFTNVLFINNKCSIGLGAAVYNTRSSAKFTNCTFFKNWCGANNGGGGVFTTSPSGTGTGDYPTATIVNCLFSANGYSATGQFLNAPNDVGSSGGNNAVTYSSLQEAGSYPNAGNTPPMSAPFANVNNLAGNDGTYFNGDDGLRLNVCFAGDAIDKGNNSAISNSTDMSGLPRKAAVDIVPDGGLGTSPIVDMGAYEDQTTTTVFAVTGSIGTSHTVPYPKELATDNITSIQSPTVSGATYNWQQSTDGTNWTNIAGATSAAYDIPSISQNTYYRRGVASPQACNITYYGNVVLITVVLPNGVIEGQVTSINGAPVQGITITATRLTAVNSGPANYNYPPVITGPDGRYTINNVYYGSAANASAVVRITPSKAAHSFNFAFLDRTLTPNTPNRSDVDFIDNTVTSIIGRTFQQCTDCNSTTGTVQTQTCPIDSILIFKGPNASSLTYVTTTGFIDTAYGRYALTVTDPTTIVIEPRLTGHTFSPVNRSVTPTDNLSGIDFRDVTTRTITGKLTAGCNNYIGIAVLEFTDVLPNAPNGSVRPSCFRKRVTTTATGTYSITLPARKYMVQVLSFAPAVANTNPNYVSEADLKSFINTKVSKDSLTRDISTSNAVLNMEYVRPPVIEISNGLNIICTTPTPFARLTQAAADSFKVFIYQGPVALGCPLSDTSRIRIITNVQQEDQTEDLYYAVADTGTKVKLTGGTPNITGDNLKNLFVYFTDKYGRAATNFNRKVLVTGVKSDAATFTTVSPEIPMVVLHDPPGDASYSTWQQSKSITNAMRFYAASGNSTESWIEAKIGAKLIVGLGVATEISAWGTIKGSINVASTNTSSNETILTTTTSQNFSTANNSGIIGTNGDVYVGAALNLVYSVATVIGFNNCAVTNNRQLLIANNGFATQYIYSEDYILNTLIPNLQYLATLSPDSAARYLNQVKVWQQVVNNNTENKAKAAFVQNYSFDGGVGAYTNSTTTTSSKTNTVEFVAEINPAIAFELGFETGGSGVSGGVNVNFKIETGKSESTTVTQETTIAYTLEDDDPGDRYSINVKKDPVYNTPVFELVAGTASCPPEPGAQARDDVFFTALNPVVQNVPAGDFANFSLRIVNISPSHETRTYKLAYDQGSNVANESVRIAGTDYTGIPITLSPLAYLDSVTVIVSIRRLPGSSVYSYEGIRFKVLDACIPLDSRLAKTVQVSAFYVSPCSNIALTQPSEGWQLTLSGNNQIFVKPAGYNLATLTSVNLQYATGSGNNWTDGPFLTTAQLASGFNFDASTLPEGAVSIRLRLDCNSGTGYSGRSNGFIDRKAPLLFGNPDPTDDRYVNGDIIGFTYDENLNTNLDNVQVTVRRLSNGQLIPATASIFNNKIIITPTNSITGLTGDSIRVIVSGINDVYGNVRTKADTTRFVVGTTVAGTGNQALTVSITSPTVYKNGDSSINVFFNLPVNAANDTRVNYTISGTARFGIDYTVTYSNSGASYAGFNGSTGSIRIAGGANQAVLRIMPVGGDTSLSPDKTIIISLTEGGDYSLGATTAVTGRLTSEDGITIYTFTGDGAWNIKNNWLNGKMPLTTLIAPKEIIINPSGTCVLNVPQTIKPGAKITVKQNRRMVIQGSLKQQ